MSIRRLKKESNHPNRHNRPRVLLPMTYVHQVYDTPDELMEPGRADHVIGHGLDHFNSSNPGRSTVQNPRRTTNDYGAYVSKDTLRLNNLNQAKEDPKGNLAYGAYGWCMTTTGLAYNEFIKTIFKKHNPSQGTFSSQFRDGQRRVGPGKAVVLSTQLTTVGT